MKKYFITGTNTDVGKTVVSALLCQWLKADYFKPIQTGSAGMLDGNTVRDLTGKDTIVHPNSYCLEVPSSPAFAAQKENIEIDIKTMKLPDTKGKNLIVEGAGGVMVPINKTSTTIDLIKHFSLPVLVVVKNELGCVSSALTTLLALRINNLEVAGVILNGIDDPLDNAGAIAHYGNVEVLAKIDNITPLTQESIANYVAPSKLLEKLK